MLRLPDADRNVPFYSFLIRTPTKRSDKLEGAFTSPYGVFDAPDNSPFHSSTNASVLTRKEGNGSMTKNIALCLTEARKGGKKKQL